MTTMREVKEYLGNLYDLPPEAIKTEFFDMLFIVAKGAKKYELDNWLKEDGIKSDERSMHDSMFHHLAKSYASGGEGLRALDDESCLDHLLHLQCRAAMLYTRRQRNIKHPEDNE